MWGSLMVSYFKVTYWVFVQLPKVKSYLTTVKHLDPISPIWWSQWLSKHELLPLVKVDNHDEIPDISSDEPEVWESKPKHKINKKSPAPTASKKTSVIKSKSNSGKVSPDPVLRPNNEVVRKRRPINFTLGTIHILRNYL